LDDAEGHGSGDDGTRAEGSVSSDGKWNVLVEIWSDVVCPWCYVGKRHFEEALSRFPQRDEVSVVWRSFELDPTAPTRSDQTMSEVLQRKYGMTEDQAEEANAKMTALAAGVGLEYHLDRVQRSNTLDAHRLLHLAAAHGLADATEERLLSAYFTEGAAIGDRATLARLAVEVGLDGEEVERMLDGDEFTAEVRSDEARAAALGAGGVPFFVIDERYGVSGAQPADALLDVLEQAWAAEHEGAAGR
jgi:predicted DsbA family dithiol-disulfide isomerase